MARTFKTKGFARAARKARITDIELCRVIAKAISGQCVDLGGGVMKARLNNNQHRSIILMKGGDHWIYEFLFAKKDQANIAEDELTAFKMLADGYATSDVQALIDDGHLTEICQKDEDDDETK